MKGGRMNFQCNASRQHDNQSKIKQSNRAGMKKSKFELFNLLPCVRRVAEVTI